MDLDSRPYRCFIAVARQRSFRRAAESLHMSQPALSGKIAELERRVGFALFLRSSRAVSLTTEGLLLLPSAERFIRETDIINIAIRDLRMNQLRIAAPLLTSLIPLRNRLFESFERGHPDIAYQIVNDTPSRCLERLAANETDLVLSLTVLPEYYRVDAKPRALPEVSADFEFQVLARRDIRLLVPDEHTLARYESIPLGALKGASVFVPGRYHGRAIAGVLREKFEELGIEACFAPEGNAIAVEQYVTRHRLLGVTLGWFADDTGPPPTMVVRPVEQLELATALTLLRNRGPSRPGARALWEIARAMTAIEPSL